MDVMGDEESEVDKTEAEVTEVRVFVAAPCQTSSRTSAMLLRSLYLTFIPLLVAIPIPNGQLGLPEVECTDEAIEVVFITLAPFMGKVFVVGHYDNEKCVSRLLGRRTTSILVNKTECGVETRRSENPSGLVSSVKVTISFHNEFLTKVDRSYEISCYYLPEDNKVSFPINVLPQELIKESETVERPECRYEVRDAKNVTVSGNATAGTQLTHHWKCNGNSKFWCMRVHSCSAGNTALLDEEGCPFDKSPLQINYDNSSLQATARSTATKNESAFQCSIRVEPMLTNCPAPKCAKRV